MSFKQWTDALSSVAEMHTDDLGACFRSSVAEIYLAAVLHFPELALGAGRNLGRLLGSPAALISAPAQLCAELFSCLLFCSFCEWCD